MGLLQRQSERSFFPSLDDAQAMIQLNTERLVVDGEGWKGRGKMARHVIEPNKVEDGDW